MSKKTINLDEIPKKLTKDRVIIECNFILSLYKDPEKISHYSNIINGEDIITKDGIFYYSIIENMTNSGYNEITDMSIYTYMESHPDMKKQYEEYGGYKTIKEIMDIISLDNSDKYYDELIKNNLLIRLYQKGFPVMQDFDKFVDMTAEQVYDFYIYELSDISVGKIEKLKVEDLSSGYKDWIEEIDKGVQVGYKINSPILNYMLAGIHPGNLTLHIAGIGQGKTTTAIILYVMSVIEHNDVLIISNEQSVNEFRSMVLSTVLFNKIGKVKGMNRQKFVFGNFTPEQKEKLNEAAEWLEKQPGKIKYVEMQDYDVRNINKIITKHSKMGCGLFIVDTIKPLNEMDERAWAQFSEVSKTLFLLAKKTNTAILCTAQAVAEANGRKYMDLSSIAKSKAIAETASQVVGFRPLTSDEVEKIEPWQYSRTENGGVNEKIKTTVKLDPDKHYICLYIMKNRFGPTMPQIIYEFNQAFCSLKEIGYYQSDYVAIGKK